MIITSFGSVGATFGTVFTFNFVGTIADERR
jgi:hypothetical protein